MMAAVMTSRRAFSPSRLGSAVRCWPSSIASSSSSSSSSAYLVKQGQSWKARRRRALGLRGQASDSGIQRPTLVLFDSQSQEKRVFEAREEEDGRVSMYVCGVTPYDYSHIGHARAYVAFDTLLRVLRLQGYDVSYYRNFTDVDDKIIARASSTGEDPVALAARFADTFHDDMEELRCLPPTAEPRVSEYIPQIVAMIERIVENGHAYAVDGGDVLFDVASYPDYGQLTGRGSIPEEDNQARVATDSRKKNAADFALWKAAKPGEPQWESPWGWGRPGWHIECSAMWESLAGQVLDIHGGGSDLKFPHHENELAQSGAATCGCAKVRFWMHNGFVTVDSEKMSKSLGNFFTIREVLKQYHPLALRLMLLNTQYRQQLNYTQRALEEASDRLYYSLSTIREALETIGKSPTDLPLPGSIGSQAKLDIGNEIINESFQGLSDDLNTPRVFLLTMEGLKEMNDLLKTKKGRKDPQRVEKLAALTSGVWQSLRLVGLAGEDIDTIISELKTIALKRVGLDESEVRRRIEARIEARKDKDFAQSDAIRDDLATLGVMLMDGPDGTEWKPAARLDVAEEEPVSV